MKGIRLLAVTVLLLTALLPFGSIAAAQDGDIVDIAVADGRFTTLVSALEAADLVDALKAEGPLTVFAPTDDAFDALPEGTVEALLEDIPALTNILLYHVVDGKVMAADVVELDSAETLQGESISISVVDGRVFLNDDVEVIITDVEATNGVIHVVDTVLLPPTTETVEEAEVEEAETETADEVEADEAEADEVETTQETLPAAGAPAGSAGSLVALIPAAALALGAAGLWARRKFRS